MRRFDPPADVKRFGRVALVAGVVGLAASVAGGVASPALFFRAYLFGYLFWLEIALGSLAILMISHLTGGAWGAVVRRFLESALGTVPLLALLFLPLLLGTEELYAWARPGALARDESLVHKAAYLNVPFFVARAALYFAVWLLLAHLLLRWSRRYDETADPLILRRLRILSGPGLVGYVLAASFAAIDWIMSLEPHWYSTIFGGLFMVSQGLTGFAFVIFAMALLFEKGRLGEAVAPAHLNDLGNLLLGFVMLWAYFSFSQYLIVWSGNLPEEVPWYLHRFEGVWAVLGLLLVLFHFAVPFLLLLVRDMKRRAGRLKYVAGGLIAVHLLEVYWLVVPSVSPEGPALHWLDFAVPVGLGGIWLAAFARQLVGGSLLPVEDPHLKGAVEHGAR